MMIKIGVLNMPNEYAIGWIALDTAVGAIYGLFIGSWGLGWTVEYDD